MARAGTRPAPTSGEATRPTLGQIVGAYKSITTVVYIRCVKNQDWPTFRKRLWQRNYYEHVIRDDSFLNEIRQYILDNPAKWELDRENPAVVQECKVKPKKRKKAWEI